jgi:carboxymethylenebutenolidase
MTGSVAVTASILTTLGCTPSAQPAAPTVPTGAPPSGPAVAPAPAATAVPQIGPDTAVPESDNTIDSGMVRYPGGTGQLIGYLARPKGAGPFPGLLIISDNRGLVEHFQEKARQVAKLGYIGLAIDMLSRSGGTQGKDPAAVSAALFQAKPEDLDADLQSSIDYLKTQQNVRKDKIGVFGFCFGGNYTYRIAVESKDVVASVPFYGQPPPAELIPNMVGAMYAVYAGNDTRVDATIPTAEAAMKAANKQWSYDIYPGVDHGFVQNLDRPNSLEQARLAWGKTFTFFDKELKSA